MTGGLVGCLDLKSVSTVLRSASDSSCYDTAGQFFFHTGLGHPSSVFPGFPRLVCIPFFQLISQTAKSCIVETLASVPLCVHGNVCVCDG